MNKFQKHILNIEKILASLSDSIDDDFESPTSLGNAREWLIKLFLRDHLPTNIRIVEGEIFDLFSEEDGSQSGQQDIILYRHDMPLCSFGSQEHKLAPVEGVLATIEVKSNLSKDHLFTALKNIKKNKNLIKHLDLSKNFVLPRKDDIFCYIFAFNGPQKDTLQDWLTEYEKENGKECTNYMADGIFCINKYFIHKNDVIKIDELAKENYIHWRKDEDAFFKFFIHLNQVISYSNILHLDWNQYLKKST